MTAFLALFRDAWRRARDRRTVMLMVIVGLLIAVFCASLGFGRPDPTRSLREHLQFEQFRIKGFTRNLTRTIRLQQKPKVDVRAPVPEDDLPQGLDHVAVADIEILDLGEFDRMAHSVREKTREGGDPVGDALLTAHERTEFVSDLLRRHGWETVITRAHDEAGRNLFVAAATDHLSDLEGSWKLGLMFGALGVPVSDQSPAEIVVMIEVMIASTFGGFIGMLILLAAFGGSMPDLLQKGSIDLVLARPVGRVRVLLFTYAGAVVTVLVVTAAIFGTCALTLGVRSGHFSLSFVGFSLTATAIFATLYPVSMLVGLVTRHATLATFASAGCWGVAGLIAGGREALKYFDNYTTSKWKSVLDALYWIMPKTSDLSNLGVRWLARTELSPAAYERFRQDFPTEIDVGLACGSCALFAGFVLAVTLLLFRRRDV